MARVKSFFESRRATMIAGSLLFVVAVSATANPGAVKRQASASATATKTGINFESLTDCHMHGPTQFCMDGSDEYQIVLEATMTKDPPTSYTDCHSHGSDTYCMNPNGGEVQVLVESATAPTQAAKETAAAQSDEITAVSNCHMHEASLYCIGPSSSEYYVQTTITNTEEYPAQLTSCHSHGEETYCMSDDGEAPILPAADVESGEADPQEEHCHFHAGVEHCVGGGSEESDERDCGRKDRDYKIGIRIGMLFVVLLASSIGVFGPILMSTFVPVQSNLVLTILKQFGTGIIISTAFVHLFTHAFMMFDNECIEGLQYEATTAAIVMAGLFISFLIEFCVQRAMRWQLTKKTETGSTYLSPKAVEKAEMANITIMEAGIVFHSILIGITLVVAGDSFFVTLSIVIIFHQLFEGIALGTRIASLGYGQMPLALGHSHSHSTPPPSVERTGTSTIPLWKKLALASGFAVVTPLGMAIGIGVLNQFNGNNPTTLIVIGTLDAFSAGILIWVGLVEMWAQDWMLGGELSDASPLTTILALLGLVCGMALMSLLGKWA
ncbi:zinc-regulated transporter 1 [Fusarium sp. NRRL 52700]|nr:zinc-regulated transporter 1 [Fusarium sp. NRRL 52700]